MHATELLLYLRRYTFMIPYVPTARVVPKVANIIVTFATLIATLVVNSSKGSQKKVKGSWSRLTLIRVWPPSELSLYSKIM